LIYRKRRSNIWMKQEAKMMTMLGITGQKGIGLTLMEMIELREAHFLRSPHQCGPREV